MFAAGHEIGSKSAAFVLEGNGDVDGDLFGKLIRAKGGGIDV